MSKPKTNYKNQPLRDKFQTPTYAVDPLIPILKRSRIKTIWECASGEGYIADYLVANEFNVIGTDITTGKDFLGTWKPKAFDCIVTNPPFSKKYKFLEQAFNYKKPFALLVPLETLGTKSAQTFIRAEEENFSFIFFNKRIKYKTPNKQWNSSPQFPSIWILYKMQTKNQINFVDIQYTKQS
jgi:hypothetical protein